MKKKAFFVLIIKKWYLCKQKEPDMKLKFTIQYATEWGQSLHVVLKYVSQYSTERQQNLTMLTDDGQQWTVETAVIESRQHPVTAIVYYYQVEDAEGEVLRQEWNAIPRYYSFDSSKNYLFADMWRDKPLNHHLYSAAYATTMRFADKGEVRPLRMPLYRKTILFRVSAPQLLEGQSVALIGSHPALGCWNPTRYLQMTPIGGCDWMLSVSVEATEGAIEYKYVVTDNQTHELIAWEEGDNRIWHNEIADGQVWVAYGEPLRLCEKSWRCAGVVVPVFALRSERSYGVGDFGDLKQLVDWAVLTGQKIIQLLPVNDTTTDGSWANSHPYNITSCFALHPHYLDLEQLGALGDKKLMTAFHRRRRELNALKISDYEAVERVKRDYVAEAFKECGQRVLESDGFKTWYTENQDWLDDYARWRQPENTSLVYFVQYQLHCQLKAAADYARQHGVSLKGDLPIGVNRESAETMFHPNLFHLEAQAGAIPSAQQPQGQNWGFPTYEWSDHLVVWLRRRLRWMAQYFDALRIDHVLAFFRLWEIPVNSLYGLLGHFSPSLPLTVGEIEYFGLPFRKDFMTRPFVDNRVIDRLFGIHSQYVRDHFLNNGKYGLYSLKPEFATQRQIQNHFEGLTDENSLWIRDGLMRLVCNVLFLEDNRQPDMYHPRFAVYQDSVFEALPAEEREAFMRLYNHYFFQRHNFFWGKLATQRLSDVFDSSDMLCCAEDLGLLPDCVAPVLDQQRILTLEVQSLPKQTNYEFTHLDGNPYRSVCTISTHDMPSLRLWWAESPERTQRYYVTMLQKQGRAPEQLPAHLAEEIIARHLYCPSMLCLLSLQDWLSMDGELRAANPREERINTPNDPYNRWQWRMHLTIEQLMAATKYNNKVRTMITRSKR